MKNMNPIFKTVATIIGATRTCCLIGYGELSKLGVPYFGVNIVKGNYYITLKKKIALDRGNLTEQPQQEHVRVKSTAVTEPPTEPMPNLS